MNHCSTIRPLIIILLPAIVGLTGCASMSEKECLTADWRQIGYEDGIAGHSTINIKEHRKACSEHGVSPNFDDYVAGHRGGLLVYCRPAKVFSLGRAGYSYPEICPTELEGKLRPAYRDGANVYQQRLRVKKVQQQLTDKRKHYNEIDENLVDYRKELISLDTTNVRRLEILAETVMLTKQQYRLDEEIVDLEEKLIIRQSELNRLEAGRQY